MIRNHIASHHSNLYCSTLISIRTNANSQLSLILYSDQRKLWKLIRFISDYDSETLTMEIIPYLHVCHIPNPSQLTHWAYKLQNMLVSHVAHSSAHIFSFLCSHNSQKV